MDNEKASKWLNETIGQDSNRTAATKAGIEHTTLRKRRAGEGVTAGDVIAVARGYGKPVVPALVETGFLTVEEGFESNTISSIMDATDIQLSDEILRRLQAGSASQVLTD